MNHLLVLSTNILGRMDLRSLEILEDVDSNSGCLALVSLYKSYIFVCGMDSTEDEQSSSETAETETGGLTKPGIELSTEIDVENHGLYVTNLCLSIPVVPLAFADNLPGVASFLSVHNFPSSFEYAIVSFLIEQSSSKKRVDYMDKTANPSAFGNLGLYFSNFFLFFS